MFAELHGGGAAGSLQSRQAQVGAKQDLAFIVASALRVEELASRGSLRKHVHREGEGDCPAYHSRIRVHYATVLLDGTCVDSSRDKNRITPVAFQLAGGKAHEAWHRSVATMRRGEVAWVESPPEYAFGPLGAPPLIPAGQALWFKLELVDFRPPGTVRGCTELAPALEEAERHLGTGREDIKRSAFAQARQAFRRARVAIPDKMLVGQPAVDVARFARVERSSLLNQALCSQKLAEGAEELAERQGHWADVVRVCSTLLRRHSQGAEAAEAEHRQEAGGDLAAVAAAIRAASADSVNDWAAKAYFRRGLAREGLGFACGPLTSPTRWATSRPRAVCSPRTPRWGGACTPRGSASTKRSCGPRGCSPASWSASARSASGRRPPARWSSAASAGTSGCAARRAAPRWPRSAAEPPWLRPRRRRRRQVARARARHWRPTLEKKEE
ncbi:unnamed protein product [Prorocentrum cordatum]|uniref:peptidylprolyl isomerase n=1 Tax=Prorocentrum cordatum TaxID=2364126 RepID=A0ABN9SNF3_9DINO|nr:unnamed protein product [Polarella glacialis]